ncbi:MAG: tail fiber domain-containing protein [Fluviibacter sp.]
MSGNFPPNPYVPNLYNPADYYQNTTPLTLNQGDDRYLRLTGGTLSGLLSCSNSCAITGNLILNGTITYTTGAELNYLHGSVPGTASASNAIVLDSSRNITNMNNITSTGILSLNNSNDAIQITNTSSTGRSNIKFTNDTPITLEFGLRGSAASNPSTAYWYFNGGYKMLMSTAGDLSILSTTQSSSYSTGCLQLSGGLSVSKLVYADSLKINNTTQSTAYTNGSVIIAGGVGIAKKLFCNDSIDCNFININNGPGIYIANGFKTALISIQNTASGYDTTIQSQPNGSSVYGVLSISGNGMLFQRSTGAPSATASCPLDFSSTLASDCIINLYGNSYMIGANNDALKLLSGGLNGVYIGNGGSGIASGYTAQITTAGSLQVGASLRATGFSTAGFAGWAGSGLEMHYSTYGQIYAYNRSTLLYRGVYIGNEVYCDGGGHTSIGLGAVASSWKLEVGSSTQSVSSYGYLNSGGGTGTSGSSGSVAFSAFFQGRIAVQGEVDVLSDQRVKSDIRDITEEEASNFIHKCMPKHYVFKPESNNEMQYGYIAQDICKAGLDTLIVCRHEEGLEEVIDGDGFISPKDTVFTVSYQKTPALLHKYILMQEERLNQQANEIAKLREDIDLLLSRPVVKSWLEKQKK